MKRRISLYIGGSLVDLADDSLILFNYTMEDLQNPTIVRNSYTKQITLKGTRRNNKIFGAMFRLDRNIEASATGIGSQFNPSKKTPFAIYNELNEILESGYVKLDNVARNGADIEYKVTLYGGLGSFLYSLSYNEEGSKRSLADLRFIEGVEFDDELNFTINAASVQAAWTALSNPTPSSLWSIINFAPAYNGNPETNFDAQKGLVKASDVGGLLASYTDKDGGTWSARNGYTLVTFGEKMDEWSVKDLRSYLQRPVLSMRSLWNALCEPSNNGGFSVNADSVLNSIYADTWLTLPMLPSLMTRNESYTASATFEQIGTGVSPEVARISTDATIPSGAAVSAQIRFNLRTVMSDVNYDAMHMVVYQRQSSTRVLAKCGVMFVQVVAYSADDTMIGGSAVRTYGNPLGIDNASLASTLGYVPTYTQSGYESFGQNAPPFALTPDWTAIGDNTYSMEDDVEMVVDALSVSYFKVLVNCYAVEASGTQVGRDTVYSITSYEGGTNACPYLFYSYDYGNLQGMFATADNTGTEYIVTPAGIRSGATITKAMLLSTEYTPADYLLSFCKMFGFHILFDAAEKSVTIASRNELYEDDTIDLTERVDLSHALTINPLAYDAKWYDFLLTPTGGQYQEEYRNIYGVEYGIQRVNTGFDFNSESKQLLSSVVLKSVASVLQSSKYYNTILLGETFYPSPFVDTNNKYALWNAAGESTELNVSTPPFSASVTYYNAMSGYDYQDAVKAQFHDAEGKPLDGQNVLLFLDGFTNYTDFKLTDDIAEMDLLNEGIPCWLLGRGEGVSAPNFRSYTFLEETIINSLDYGIPRELHIPEIQYSNNATIYARCWRDYLADRYDVNTRVMTCKVHFYGMQVGEGLLRKFYWYDNALWTLNAIRNYSLTTYDPVECEFVQVQDKGNYLNGQTI